MTLKRLGHIDSIEVSVDGVSISNYISKVIVFADMFAPSIVAEIHVQDYSNLLSSIPIKAFSKVSLSIVSDSTGLQFGRYDLTLDLSVAAITDRKSYKKNQLIYKITAIGDHIVSDLDQLDQSVFINEKPTECITKLLDKVGIKQVKVGTPINTVTWSANGLTPLAGCYYLSKMCLAPNNRADYILYQDGNKSFSCKSIDDLLNQPISINIYNTAPNIRLEDHSLKEQETNALHIDIIDFNGVGALRIGANKSQMTSIDPLTRSKVVKDFKLGDDGNNDINPVESYNANMDAKVGNKISIVSASKFNTETNFNNSADWSQSRRSSLTKAFNQRLVIDHFFHTDMFNRLGKVADLKLLDNKLESGRAVIDEQYGGKALVTAVALEAVVGSISFMKVEYAKIRPNAGLI